MTEPISSAGPSQRCGPILSRAACWSWRCCCCCWGGVRGGLVVATAIPLSMLFAFTGMVRAGLSGNLMSLGAIDFGLVVDGSVVMIENIVRKVSERKEAGGLDGSRDLGRRTRGCEADRLRGRDHHHRLPADPDAGGGRGKDVPAHGAHRDIRARRLADPVLDSHAGAGVLGLPQGPEREGDGAAAMGKASLPAAAGVGG